MGTSAAHVLRVDLKYPKDLEDIPDLEKKAVEIHAVYQVFFFFVFFVQTLVFANSMTLHHHPQDPTGGHVLISMVNGDNYFLHESWKKPKVIKALNGVVISSMAWDMSNKDKNNSGSVLAGTTEGQIFEAVFDCNEKAIAKTWSVVYNVGGQSVEGLTIERLPDNRLYIMGCTASRIFEFQGQGSLAAVFQRYEGRQAPYKEPAPFATATGRAELHITRGADGIPRAFAWMTERGICHGRLELPSQGESAIGSSTILKFDRNRSPVSMTVTDLHFVCAFPDYIRAIRKLDEKVVAELTVLPSSAPQAARNRVGKIQGISVDSQTQIVWIYSQGALCYLDVVDEDRDMCGLYLQRGQYDLAKQYAKTEGERDVINGKQADAYFAEGNYEKAAIHYGKTNRRFEEITLKFIDCESRDALRRFLEVKLNSLSTRDSTQKTMIATWLVEIYLNRLNSLHEEGSEDSKAREELKGVEGEFRQLLEEQKQWLDYKTTITLISSHGRSREMIFYATMMEDYERVINVYINERNYVQALNVLLKQTNEELFYRFSPILMHHIPYETVNLWQKASSFLKPRKLIPALMRYNPANNPANQPGNQAIRYLEYCVKMLNNTEEAIHNYLLSLYAQFNEEQKLLKFLENPNPCFDLKYGLRLCAQYKMDRAQVMIYGCMELYEEAVDAAITLDLELAKVYANRPDDDDERRKGLWLRIAKHVVAEGKNMKRAMEFLKECEVLKIEDILPFFPEFSLIDSFKDEICASLESYNKDIEDLRQQMDQSTQSAEEIRSDIQKLNHKYGFVESQQKCQLCDSAVLTREFYLFPCQHVYHADCLQTHVVKQIFTEPQRQQFSNLQGNIRQLESQARSTAAAAAAGGGGGGGGGGGVLAETRSRLQKLRAQLDELVAPECLLCGDHSLQSIDKPFILPSEASEAHTWHI